MVYVAFDLLGARGRGLRLWPLSRRRERLAAVIGAGNAGVQLMLSTLDLTQGQAWISAEQAAVGIEGTVAKPLASRYPLRGDRAGWVKVRHFDDVDALVLGVTGSPYRPTALVLGQTDRAVGYGRSACRRPCRGQRSGRSPVGSTSPKAGLSERPGFSPVSPGPRTSPSGQSSPVWWSKRAPTAPLNWADTAIECPSCGRSRLSSQECGRPA
ncbi:hypothetical protein [Amycolatopsis sp. FDAARGOS 1241]|uniref:hypothetical protein n=1 Tax=Amycolatopsis sp. FDAARGOS 1241 TaxID=2778070 RepID=UPI0019527233|nr:hypothetical protein [Amycolatopsis sp. FDAARGOS 1241]QRP47925.1 hypothetical protein I6J71_08510 [Amycolatopsis sp. FDAARGOS 1241]